MLARFIIGQPQSSKYTRGVISHVFDGRIVEIGKEAEFQVLSEYDYAMDFSKNPIIAATQATEEDYNRIVASSLESEFGYTQHGVQLLLHEVNTGLVGTFFISHKRRDLISLFSQESVRVRTSKVSIRQCSFYTLKDVNEERRAERVRAIKEFNWKQENPNGDYRAHMDALIEERCCECCPCRN